MTSCLRIAICLGVGIILAAPAVVAQAPTTIILVRHAEKGGDPSDRDPELSEAGRERARTLAHAVGELGISAIYSTPYLRTLRTVEPIAETLDLEITVTPITPTFKEDVATTLRENHGGEVVLIVGHSNTIPPLVNALGAGPFENLEEHEYDDMFVVTLAADGSASVLRMRYGRPTP